MIESVLFDLDGTLIDSRVDLANAVNYALRLANLEEQPVEKIVRHVGNGVDALIRGVMPRSNERTITEATKAYRFFYSEHLLDNTKLYDGVAVGLSRMSKQKALAIVTNKPAAFTERILKGLGVRKNFKVVIGGDSLPDKKPHPAPLLKALSLMGISPASAMMVGDGEQDVEAGKAAGTQTCLAQYGFGFKPATVHMGPDFVVNNFSELKELVL